MIHSKFVSFKRRKSKEKALNGDKKILNDIFMENDYLNFDDTKNIKKRRYKESLEDYSIEEKYFEKLLKDENEEETNNIKKRKLENNIFKSNSNAENNASEKHDLDPKDDFEKALCTIFVGNLPISVVSSKSVYKNFKTKFLEFGKIKSIRFRSIAFSTFLPKKIAYIQKKFHTKRDLLNAYIVYETQESSKNALALNGVVFLDRHLRVDSVAYPAPHVPKRSIFIGNLSFDAQEEQLWSYFAHCGEIEFVRIVRDNKTNLGKGFAYVQFKDRESIDQALLLHDKEGLCGRKLRVIRAKNIPKNRSRSEYKEKNKILNTENLNKDISKKYIQHNIRKKHFDKNNYTKLVEKNMVFEGKRASKNHK
ncbi:unnamed protein product [Pneumocystis jirovecii]|uniref:Nucleolar protein 12 n=1 Tax=Pneumocystis jirovecii TaxID=42068 RepID=L0P948_PNEJI|nr:unnamed protein product [Pneumocystis jirovecii]